jgi:hypothetical protein
MGVADGGRGGGGKCMEDNVGQRPSAGIAGLAESMRLCNKGQRRPVHAVHRHGGRTLPNSRRKRMR